MTGSRQRRKQRNASSGVGSANKEAGGPSNPTSSNSKVADPLKDCDADSVPVLEPKQYDIFIIHHGAQKEFTMQLCKRLASQRYGPFFDGREDSSLLERIISAARQCRVAILILSEEFFTNSKWPMLKLAAFVDAHKESREKNLPEVSILPVYLGLSRKECRKNEQRRSNWLALWKRWEDLAAEKGDRSIDVGKWEVALKVLGPANGIEYKQSSGEAGLIHEIANAVGDLPPSPFISKTRILAMGRICETIMRKISETTASSNGARVVGVYGMGEIEMKNLCEEFCDRYREEFEGNVCHVPLGSKRNSKLINNVVPTLTNVNYGSLALVDDSKVTEPLQNPTAGERVFMALDNVRKESTEKARVIVRRARYGHGSIVLVTAESIDILESLQIDKSDCLSMREVKFQIWDYWISKFRNQ